MSIKITSCVCCGSQVETILDWGDMPLANNYNIKELYPIKLNKCAKCFHLQLDEMVEPEILFKDYPYFSGTSKTSIQFFNEFAEMALRYYPEAKTVLDIACNDGTQLDSFKELGLQTYGVDPAENLLPVSTKKGHDVLCNMFPCEVSIQPDIITAQNVVAHTPEPFRFLWGCRDIMHDDSFLFLTASQANMIVNTEYDTIYHEHCSYYNTMSMHALVERAGMHLVDVFTNPIHGTSYVFVIKKVKPKDPVDKRVLFESLNGLYSNETYTKWVVDCKHKAKKTKGIIEEYRNMGFAIIGCGAAAKGITFMNMSKTQMDFIVDTTPAKWYSRICNTTIYPFEYLKTVTDERVLFVILAWNFADEIKQNVLKFRNHSNDQFITTNQ